MKKKKKMVTKPTKMTPETIAKLEAAFAIDATIAEACFYAGINDVTYFRFKKEYPEKCKQMEALRLNPVLAARERIAKSIKTSDQMASWFLERKRKNEFAVKTITSGEIVTSEMDEKHKKRVKDILAAYDEDE